MASEIQPSSTEPEFYLQPTDTIFSLKAPSASTVCRLLNQLDAKKATGLDRIPCKLLKLSSSIVGPSLAYIFKSCIDAEIFPNEWKFAKVTPLFKKGSKRELGNYRPISVLPFVSKVFEKIIYHQLYDYLQENRLLNTYQSGFRSMHSTTTARSIVRDILTRIILICSTTKIRNKCPFKKKHKDVCLIRLLCTEFAIISPTTNSHFVLARTVYAREKSRWLTVSID